MINWKALIAGSAATLGLGLMLQLLFSFLLVAQLTYGRLYPQYAGVMESASLVMGVVGYLLIMAVGGYITSLYARTRVCLHALIVAGSVGLVSLWLLPDGGNLTPRALLLLIAGAAAALAGSRCWRAGGIGATRSS